MSSQEIFVVVVLGLVGYWGTSAVIQHFQMKGAKAEADKKFAKEQAEQRQKEQDQQQYEHEEGQRRESASSDDNIQHWTMILDVSAHASLDEIKEAYKKKISMYHPDKVSGLGPEFNEIAQKKSKQINAAYDEAVLSKA